MILTPDQANAFYDRFGSKQDAQAFDEVRALSDLITHGQLDQALSLFKA